MAFPSNNSDDLDSAWSDARGIAGTVKNNASQVSAASLAGPVTAMAILRLVDLLASALVRLNQCAAVPGIAAYAQAQVNNPGFDVVGAFNAMTAGITSTVQWVMQNFPASGGFLLVDTFNGDGTRTSRSFDTATLAGFRTQLAALIATIN